MGTTIILSPAVPIVACALLYLSDYYLTLYGARLHKEGAREVIAIEGSYELNPLFVTEIDLSKKVSLRLLGMLAGYSFFILAAWFLALRLLGMPQLYLFAAGATLLLQGPIHLRHLRNIQLLRRAKERDGVDGRITCSRRLNYSAAAVDLVSFSGLYLLLSLAVGSWLLAGGAFASALQAFANYRLSKDAEDSSNAG